jgi:hypothetical protein
MSGWIPRVKGKTPGVPMSETGSVSLRSSGVEYGWSFPPWSIGTRRILIQAFDSEAINGEPDGVDRIGYTPK